MTPQEKADNLVNQFRIVLMNEDTECGNEILCSRIAKDCALIAVDEVLNYDLKAKTESQFIIERRIEEYWTEVKQEIEKL